MLYTLFYKTYISAQSFLIFLEFWYLKFLSSFLGIKIFLMPKQVIDTYIGQLEEAIQCMFTRVFL